MIFSKSNPPTGYYVYLYLREDGTPYYVGKGKGTRAWTKLKKEIHKPKDIKVACPHCPKSGATPGMKRWHFDKCKLRII